MNFGQKGTRLKRFRVALFSETFTGCWYARLFCLILCSFSYDFLL